MIIMLTYVFRKPLFWFVFLGYLLLAVFVSGFYNTLPLILRYASTVSWFKLSVSFLLTLAIAFLISLNAVLVVARWREKRACQRETAVGSIGTIAGLAVGVCPLCVTGLFPLFLGLFGVTFSFASLPFQGLEIQVFIVVLLSVNVYFLRRRSAS